MARARKPPPTQKDFKHVWYVQEWLELYGKRQVDLINGLGWSKAKASDVMGGQQYTQSIIDDLKDWLNVKPYELLMTPADAMAIRNMRDAAVKIAADNSKPEPAAAEPPSFEDRDRRAS